MDTVYYIAKVVAITELILIVLLIVVSYLLKVIFSAKEKRNAKLAVKIHEQLTALFNSNQTNIPTTTFKFFKKNILIFLVKFSEFENIKAQFPNWDNIVAQLSNHVFKPVGRKFSSAHGWFKRYIAVLCFGYGFDHADNKLLTKLTGDDNLLVSMNAAKAIAKFPTLDLIKSVVYTFAKGRRLQQSADAVILAQEGQNFVPMLLQILQEAQDPYVKTFCYRLLTQLPSSGGINPSIETDIANENLDLKIAALNYLAHTPTDQAKAIIFKSLDDPRWQVRAVAVKILGDIGDESVISPLTVSLKDPEWWVRINSANALMLLGKPGISALREQLPEADKYAYEAAQEVLKTIPTTEGS